jgi:hypothetical protein
MHPLRIAAFALLLGACAQAPQDHQVGSPPQDIQEVIKHEIAKRNVGYNVGQNLPWEVSESCFATRDDASHLIMIEFGEIKGQDRGEYYRISISDLDALFGLPDKKQLNGNIALDGIPYPPASGNTVRMNAWYDLKYNDIIFGIDDTKHRFRDALFTANEITFMWEEKSLTFSMADSTRLRARLAECYGDRFAQIDWAAE